jgi:signal recognition particle GTPase
MVLLLISLANQLKKNAMKAKIPIYVKCCNSQLQLFINCVLISVLTVVLQLYRPHPVKTIVEGLKRYWKEICDLIFEDTSSGTHRQEAALFEEIWQASEATVCTIEICK